ncbi:MAG: pentapeptide repeat-containing protein, partial [Pseudomonadota bacterium]
MSDRTLQNWAAGNGLPNYSLAMAGLMAIGYEAEAADRELERLFKRHNVTLIRHDGSRSQASGDPAESYRAALRDDFENAQLFGETTATLADLYVWPRVAWCSGAQASGRPDMCGDLKEAVWDWLGAGEDQRLKLIFGGPGAGKSSFARAIAAELARDESVLPILVPLHQIDLSFYEAQAEIASHVAKLAAFDADFIFRETGPQRVFIFDGLDELVLPDGPRMRSIAAKFLSWTEPLMRAQPSARFIVLGRTAMMDVFRKQVIARDEDFLHLQGLGPLDPDMKLTPGSRRSLLADQRPEWWRKYAAVSGAERALPAIFSSRDFDELTNEPLLCYLIGLAGLFGKDLSSTLKNEAGLYGHLLKKIFDRDWAHSSGGGASSSIRSPRVGITRDISMADFEALLQAVAYAAWQEGSMRVARYPTFNKACSKLGLDYLRPEAVQDLGERLESLALTFYFKGTRDQRGFEFTHQTFAEYLLARGLLSRFRELCLLQREPGADVQNGLLDWLEFINGVTLNDKTISFLKQCAADLPADQRTTDLATARDLMNHIIRDGLPLHRCPLEPIRTGREMETLDITAQAAFLNCLSALAVASQDAAPVAITWPSQSDAGRFLSRFTATRTIEDHLTPGIAGLSFDVRLSGAGLVGRESVMTGSVLHGIFLSGADLTQASFFGANMERAMLAHAKLQRTDLTGAQLAHADMANSQISGSDLSAAQIDQASFRSSKLENTDLRDVRGKNTQFSHARVEGCAFLQASLPEANFSETKLKDVSFTGAMLEGASFRNSVVIGQSSFRDANLCRVDFSGAELREADFTGAQISGAVLAGA